MEIGRKTNIAKRKGNGHIRKKTKVIIALTVLTIVCIPVGFIVYFVLNFSFEAPEPDRAYFEKFRSKEIDTSSVQAEDRINRSITKAQAVLGSGYKLEAKSKGDRCYIDGVGKYAQSYNKDCYMRKMVVFSSPRDVKGTIRDVEAKLKALKLSVDLEGTLPHCLATSTYSSDDTSPFAGDRWIVGSIRSNRCIGELKQVDALFSRAEYRTHMDRAMEYFPESEVFSRIYKEGRSSFVVVAFDDGYFSERIVEDGRILK